MNLPNGVIIISPETTGHILAANTRLEKVVLEPVPARMIWDLGEGAMSIAYDALDSTVGRGKVIDVSW